MSSRIPTKKKSTENRMNLNNAIHESLTKGKKKKMFQHLKNQLTISNNFVFV